MNDHAWQILHGRVAPKQDIVIIGDGCVECSADGEISNVSPVDQVLIAAGMRPVNALGGVLEKLGIPFAVVGNARKPRRIIEATEEGARAAWDL